MKIQFTKLQASGNDFLLVDAAENKISTPAKFAKEVCRRRYSIGADGVIFLKKSSVADAKVEIFNADGTPAESCGNGICCAAKYLYDCLGLRKSTMSIETDSGVRMLSVSTSATGCAEIVRVDMGVAKTTSRDVPALQEKSMVGYPVELMKIEYRLTAVFLGAPYVTTFCADLNYLNLQKIGPYFESLRIFPNRTNADFVKVVSPIHIQVRAWERGCGEVLSSGTGACAAVAAAVLNHVCPMDQDVTVELPGGKATVFCNRDMRVFLSAKTDMVFDGEIDYCEVSEL